MPLMRYQIRNEYGLADMELYGAADKDDPEALLEGVAMAGLVGVLRQLGDLADFAAEIFRCLHEELTETATRGQSLVVRVQQLEAGFPVIEKAVLSQADLSSFFSDPGTEWHPNLQTERNLITHGELPHCITNSYEECRGPPRLSLLDKFDVAGAGACMKRYSDPSLFNFHRATSEVGKEKRVRKPRKKESRLRNEETPELAPTSHPKLRQLFSMEHVDSGYRDPVFHVKLKRRQFNESPVNSSSRRGYMEKFLHSPSPDCEKAPGYYLKQQVSTLGNESSCESGAKEKETSAGKTAENLCWAKETEVKVCNAQEDSVSPSMAYLNSRDTIKDRVVEPEPVADDAKVKMPSAPQKRITIEKPLANLEGGATRCLNITFSGDLTSRVNNCTDAFASVSQSTETDNNYALRNNVGFLGVGKLQIYSDADENQEEVPSQCSDTKSIGHTSTLDVYHSFEEGSNVPYSDIPSPSALASPSNGKGSAERVNTSFSQPSMNKNPVGMATSEVASLSDLGDAKDSICKLEETPFCFSCENLRHLHEDPATSVQFGSEKLHANEIGMTFSETSAMFEVHFESRDAIDASLGAYSVHLPKLPCAVPEAECSKNKVLQTTCADDFQTGDLSNTETESVISFSVLMEEPFSCLTSQEMEVCPGRDSESMEPKDISSGADVPVSAAEIDSEFVMPVEVDLGKILPTGHAGTTSFEDLSPVATLANNNVPAEDKVHLKNASSVDTETENKVSFCKNSSKNGTRTPDTPWNFQKGSEHTSASSHDSSVGPVPAGMAIYHGQEDLQPVSTVSDDSQHGELLAKDNNVEEEAVIEASLLQHQKELEQTNILSSECCTRSQGQGLKDPPEIASGDLDPYVLSVQEVFADLQDSSPAESETGSSKQDHLVLETDSLPQTIHLQGSEKTLPSVASYPERYDSKQFPELEALHAEHLPEHTESSISVNNCSEVMLSADHIDQGTCLNISPETNLPISGLLQEAVQTGSDGMPPPPPLPPTQWWTGKPQPAAQSALDESVKITEAPVPVGKTGDNLTTADIDSWVPMGENALQSASTAALPLPAVKHAAVDSSELGTGFEGEAVQHVQQNSGEILDPNSAVSVSLRTKVQEKPQPAPCGSDGETEPPNVHPKDVLTSSWAGKTFPVDVFGPLRTLGDGNPHENSTRRKVPRTEAPLGDAVPAIDRSMLRKVSERGRPPAEPRVDEKDSLLELIRNQSFNLRPAVSSRRPNVQMGPKTNLKVAAILEKANTLRQAMAGSDDDDDSDSWSDT